MSDKYIRVHAKCYEQRCEVIKNEEKEQLLIISTQQWAEIRRQKS